MLKPAEQTPVSALRLAALVAKAGFPPGVINIVNGLGREADQALVSHPGISNVAFTGSTSARKQIMRSASVSLTPVKLETGGKSPLLVFEDANLDQAAKWAYIGIMTNQGQICTATSRLIIHKKVEQRFLDAFKQIITRLNVVRNPFT